MLNAQDFVPDPEPLNPFAPDGPFAGVRDTLAGLFFVAVVVLILSVVAMYFLWKRRINFGIPALAAVFAGVAVIFCATALWS